jgi:hypothetical protein
VSHADESRVQYRLTSHAEKIIAMRGISRAWIDRVLADPIILERDKEDCTLRFALARIPERGDMILRVVYNATVKPWSVVTASFDRRAGRVL